MPAMSHDDNIIPIIYMYLKNTMADGFTYILYDTSCIHTAVHLTH